MENAHLLILVTGWPLIMVTGFSTV